jgi:acetyl esterase/lipase
VWHNRSNRAGWSAYLGRAPGAPELPAYAAAARRADLRGLPPAWIGVGDLDLFLDEGRAYAERLERPGSPWCCTRSPARRTASTRWRPTCRSRAAFAARQHAFLRERLVRFVER